MALNLPKKRDQLEKTERGLRELYLRMCNNSLSFDEKDFTVVKDVYEETEKQLIQCRSDITVGRMRAQVSQVEIKEMRRLVEKREKILETVDAKYNLLSNSQDLCDHFAQKQANLLQIVNDADSAIAQSKSESKPNSNLSGTSKVTIKRKKREIE